MILGAPVFDASAPRIRLRGRRIANWWTNLETLWAGISDSLFGFRVYPIAAAGGGDARAPAGCGASISMPRRWCACRGAACRSVNLPAPCRYFTPGEGGVSHFNYWRDNVLLTWMYTRLFAGFLVRLPLLIARRRAR